MPIFIPRLAPVDIDSMLELLKQCAPKNMTALKKCLDLPEEDLASTRLELADFVDAIAYPIQSYRITRQSKMELYTEIKRLYPNPAAGPNATLRAIMERINPDRNIPVAIDNIQPQQDLTLTKEIHTKLLGGVNAGHAVKGLLDVIKEPLTKRWHSLLSQCKLEVGVSDDKLAKTYQAILNLLYLESTRVKETWEWLQIERASRKLTEEYFSLSRNRIRVSAEIDSDFFLDGSDRSNDSDEDFAFAVQHNLMISNIRLFIDNKQYQELIELYNNLLSYHARSANPGALHTLAYIRKELAVCKIKEFEAKFYQFDKACHLNRALSEFTGEVKEELFAPCNITLQDIDQQFARDNQQALEEYRTQIGIPAQQVADTKAVCKIYGEIAADQAELYDYVYKLLQDVVNSKKSKMPWMKYFKLYIQNVGQQALPPHLPRVDLQELDMTAIILNELENPPLEDWFVPPPPVAKKKSTPSKTKLEPASAIAQHSKTDNHEEIKVATAKTKTTDVTYADTATRMPVQKPNVFPVSTPAKLTPFKYASRVLRWFKANAPLDQRVFPEYIATSVEYQKLIIAYHAFSSSVDAFVINIALEIIWNNPTTGFTDKRYILPAEISIPELGKTSRGVITYCVGKSDGQVYHRFFSEKPAEEIVRNVFKQAFKDSDFPTLESTIAKQALDMEDTQLPSRDPDEEISKHSFFGTISIENRRTKTKITLFPVKSEHPTP